MAKHAMRVATTRTGKQLSGYFLLKHDMLFAARAFALAAMRGVRSAQERWANRPSVEDRVRAWQAMDPILRAGAAIMQSDDVDDRDESEAEKRALFEAGIVTYGRCFNKGLRTKLNVKIFSGGLLQHKKLHDAMIVARNKHIAHSELRMEQSTIGFRLVDDENYGKRPSIFLGAVTMRRHFPTDDRLAELESHCRTIIDRVIDPVILEKVRALREQLLQMSAEQIEDFPEFGAAMPIFEDIL